MTLHRFFVAPGAVTGDRFALPTPIEHQVRAVLRLGEGDRIVLLTGDGSELTCRIETGDCVVERRQTVANEPKHRLTVVQALLKQAALESLVQHATEIGVASFTLIVTEHCVVREISARRLERLRRIAREAAEQSERGIVPPVEGPMQLADVLDAGSVLLYERHGGARLTDVEAPGSLIIGPEGGFSPSEVAGAERAGATLAGLGPRILRSETVAVAAASVILSRTGDFA